MPLFRAATRRRCLTPGSWTIETHTLDNAEAELIAAIAEQLVPLDTEPDGASQCRCVQFIDQQLETVLSRLRPAYHQGLRAFDLACRAETGSGFLELSNEQRAGYLNRIAHGHKLAAFCEILHEHAKRSLTWNPLQLQKPFVQSHHTT